MPKAPAGTARRVRKNRGRMPRLAGCDTVLTGAVPSEHLEQVETVAWFRRTYPGVRIFAIPNGGHRGIREAGRLKAEGVSAGVPDLYIPAWNVWVEMKRRKGGSVSKEQKDWHAYLREIGDTVLVCKGFDDARDQLTACADRADRFTSKKHLQARTE